MKLIVGTLLAALSAAQEAKAEDWIQLGFSASGFRVLLDLDSVVLRGGVRLGRSQVITGEPVWYLGQRVKRWQAEHEVDCGARRQRSLAEIGYDEAGARVYQHGEEDAWTAVPTETMAAVRLEAICRARPQVAGGGASPTPRGPGTMMR